MIELDTAGIFGRFFEEVGALARLLLHFDLHFDLLGQHSLLLLEKGVLLDDLVAEFVAGEAGHHVDLVVDVAAEVLLGLCDAFFLLSCVDVSVLGEHAQFVLNRRDRVGPYHSHAFKLLVDQLVVVLKARYLVAHHALFMSDRL